MKNIKKFKNFNENISVEYINESKAKINASVGRLNYGFQKACYDYAFKLGLKIDIKRIPGILEVDYIIMLEGDEDKMREFHKSLNKLSD